MNEQHMKWSEDLSQSAYYAEMCTPFYMSHKLFQQQRAQQSAAERILPRRGPGKGGAATALLRHDPRPHVLFRVAVAGKGTVRDGRGRRPVQGRRRGRRPEFFLFFLFVCLFVCLFVLG